MMFYFRKQLIFASLSTLVLASPAMAQEAPSFKCSENMSSSVQALICKTPDLAALDRTLAATYRTALKKAGNRANALKAEQRGWIKGRDDCWKSDDATACVRDSYGQRIIELQTAYSLVASTGPVIFDCANHGSISTTFFQTDPPSLTATYKGQRSLMVAVPAASGVNYKGQNESLWEHQGEARVRWGYGSQEMTCKKKA